MDRSYLLPAAAAFSSANSLDVKVNNKNMGGDPNVGADKKLKVEYTYQGRTSTKVVKEGDRLQLP